MGAHARVGRGLAAFVLGGLTVLTVGGLLGAAQERKPDDGAAKTTVKGSAAVAGGMEANRGERIEQAKEVVELLEMQLEAKQASLRIGEARLAEATHWKTHYANLLRDGKVTEERYLAAKDDVLAMEAHLASEKCDVKAAEIRLNYARRRLKSGESPRLPLELRLEELEHRLGDAETKIDLLQHDVARLRRERPSETSAGSR